MTHFGDIVLDEIALEGLDGITLSALWTRLEARLKMEDICYGRVPVSKETYEYIWEICRDVPSIFAYVLPAPRPQLVIFDRFACVDEETEMPYEPTEPIEDIYPVKPIEDKITGNRGSCAEYFTRTEVTQEIRNMSFEQVSQKWGDALVLVASQAKRNRALLGPNWNPTFILHINAYLMVERIGRARYLGELSVGKLGLGALNMPLKSSHYYRKPLLKHNLVTKQGFFSRNAQGKLVSCLLLHLTRFYIEYIPNLMLDYIHLVRHLKTVPNHTMLAEDARNQVSRPLKKMLKFPGLKKNVLSSERVLYRSFYPGASEEEYSYKGRVGEKTISILRLVEPDVREQDLLKTPDEDEEIEDGEDDDDGVEGILDMSRILQNYRMGLGRLAYEVIREAGPQGLSQTEFGNKLGLSKLDSRTILRYFTKHKVVSLVTLQVKRQKTVMYIVPTEKENQIPTDLEPSITGTSTYQRPKPQSKKPKQVTKSLPASNIPLMQGAINAHLEDETVELEASDLTIDLEAEECEAENVIMMDVPLEEGIVVAESMANDVLITETMHSGYRSCKERITKTLDADSELITDTKQERRKYLLEIINKHSIISGSASLRHEIIRHEERSGKSSYGTICKKTLWSLLAELELKGEISVYFFQLSGYGKQNLAEFICKKGVTKEHAEIRSALEQNSLKLGALMRKPGAKRSGISELEEGVPHLNKRRKSSEEEIIAISSTRSTKAARQLGYEPKCIRMQILHNYLFYLARDYRGKTDLDQVSSFAKLLELHDIDKDLAKTLPNLYCDAVCPEMFVQPLPEYKDYEPGWLLVGDIIFRMPLSIFLKLVNTNYAIPGISEYMNHPVKRHLPISCLPKEITKYLLYARKYLFSTHYNLENLCFAGLIQFGPSLMKGKDQVMVYVNKHASIRDTTITPPSFLCVDENLTYQTKEYTFEKMEDLYKYWEDLNFVARGTLLGSYEGMEGQMIEMTELKKKPGIIRSLDPKTNEEAPANDLGAIPGDNLGACGFDSAFYIHLRRNWTFVSNMPTEGEVGRSEQKITKKEVNKTEEVTVTLPSAKPQKEGEKGRRGKSKVIKKKGKSQTIIVSEPIKRKRVPIYDEKDQISLANMTSLRVDWSEKEDEALTLAQAVSCYIYPNSRNVRVPGFAIRDVLHKVLPEISKNKTSRSCTRRILFLIKKQPLLFSEANLLTDELSCDPEIIEKYPPIADFETKVGGIEKKNQELCRRFKDLFIDLYSRLEDRPISMLTMLLGSSVSLPNTLQGFYNYYEMFTPVTRSLCTHQHQEVRNEYDVTQFSLQTVLFSTYMNTDKMSRTRQILAIYQMHTDNVLREAFNNFRASGVLSAVKKKKRSDKVAALRANLDYRLSVRLIHQLRGKCQSDFFAMIDADAFTSRNIKNVYENSSELSLDEYNVVGQKESGLCTIYTSAETIFSFKSTVEVPDELIVLNPDQLPKSDDVDEIVKQLEGVLVKIGMEKEKARSILEAEKVEYQKSTGNQETTSVGRLTVRKNLQEEYVPILLTDNVSIINETRKDTNLNTRLLNATAKHLCLSTDRSLTSGKNEAQDIECDLFVIRACPLKVNMLPHQEKDLPLLSIFIADGELKSSKKCQMTATVTKKSRLEEMIISKSRVKLMKGEINDQFEEFTEEELNVACEVVAYLISKEAVGATKSEVLDEFCSIPKTELARVILKLLCEKLIYKVGTVSVRYVSYKFASKWAVLTYHLKRLDREKLPSLNPEKGNQISDITEPPSKRKRLSKEAVESEEKQKSTPSHDKFFVILRPWIRVDGSLNRSGLSFMLLSVLSHVIDRPATTMTEIAENFLPSLANIITYDLIEILEEMHCVTRYLVMKQPVSLFSKRSLIYEIRPAHELDLENEVRVEATPESAVKLALLMHGSFSSHTNYKCPCH